MTIDLHEVTDWIAYWVVFWTIVNAFLPPRELFKDASPTTQKRYNMLLQLVAFYGAINVRQLTVKMYDSVNQQQAVATPHQLDNALVDAAAATEKTAEAVKTAQESVEHKDG